MSEHIPHPLVMLAAVLAILFLVFDLLLPLGVAGGIPYIALVLFGIWLPKEKHVYALAVIGSVFTVVGYFASSPGSALWIVLTNRALAMAAIWVTAILISSSKRAEAELAASKEREALQKNQSALINERLHSAIESFPDGFVLYDPDDRLIMCNQAFREMWAGINDLIKPGVYFHELAAAIETRGLAEKEEAVKKRTWVYDRLKRNFEDEFLEIQLANGRWILHHDHRTPDEGHAGIRIDVTERKRAEMNVLKAKEDAEKANKAKSEFLASMSHELRTPLNAILGFGQMMKLSPKDPLSPKQAEYMDDIIAGGEHLLELVNDVLDLVNIEANQVTLSMEHIYSNDIIDESIALIAPVADARHVTLINRTVNKPLSRIRADALRLKQALINLLSNAVKYNVDDGRVVVDSQETDDGFLHISVTDTGIGMGKEHHGDVFKIFHRLDSNPMKAVEGTGIGLAVTKQLVERMGGRIGFESVEGQGSTFWIEMPLTSIHDELVWQDTLSIGIEEIDEDHKVLVSLLDKLTDRTFDRGDVDEVISELINYTLYHFKREEVVMEACSYPKLEEHRIIHQQLAEKAGQLAERWRKDANQEVVDELLVFLRAWLVEHIMHEDAAIGPFAKGKEVEIARALADIEV